MEKKTEELRTEARDRGQNRSPGQKFGTEAQQNKRNAAALERKTGAAGKGDRKMYDQVTLKLNVDPLILSALREDITSEDVSANSIMKKPQAGEVDLICKQDGIICGLQVFERVFTLLDENTKVEFFAEDGDEVKNGQLLARVFGDIRVLLCGERTASF